MRLVRTGGEVNGAGEQAQPVGFASRVHRTYVPDDFARAHIENPGGGRPRRLLIVLPVLVVTAAQPVRPWLGSDGGQREVARRLEDEDAHPMLLRGEILNIDQLGLNEDEQQREMHG